MNKVWMTSNSVILLFCSLFLFFTACQEPLEDCLNIEASNFNPTADRDCCCTFPSLFVEVAYRAGDVSFTLNTPYELENGDTVIFRRAAFYISDVVVSDGLEEFTPRDTFWVYSFENNILDSSLFVGSLGLINRTASDFNMGRFREEGLFTKARFRLGVNETLNNQPFQILPRRSRMAIQADSMHTFQADGGFLFLRFVMEINTVEEPIEIRISRADGEFILERNIEMISVIGINKRFRLNVDYLAFLRGIDFVNDNDMQRRAKLLSNLDVALQTE